jgi:hypothetical protein
MSIQLATVLPFLAARLNVDVPDLLAMPAGTVARIFGRHAVFFLQEVSANPTRAQNLTEAEKTAFPAIKETVRLASENAG